MPLRGLSVLVVEDDRDHRELAQEMLTALGARVTVVANGEEGVKRLIEDGCPDLILCDLRMPVMDGFEFAREVRTHSPCRRWKSWRTSSRGSSQAERRVNDDQRAARRVT